MMQRRLWCIAALWCVASSSALVQLRPRRVDVAAARRPARPAAVVAPLRGVVPLRAEASPATGEAVTVDFAEPVTLGLCCVIASVCALDRVVMSVAILPMSGEFGYDDATKGLIAAAFSLGYGIGLAPAGALAARGSPRAVLGAGLLGWSLFQAVTPLAAHAGLGPLLLARAGMGVGEAAAIPAISTLAGTYVSEGRRSRFWGFLTASLSLGTICAYAATPPLVDNAGWASAFYAFGGGGAAVAACWFAFAAPDPAAAPDAGPRELPWARLNTEPVRALAAAHAASNFFLYFSLSWLPTFFAYTFGDDAAAASSASLLPFAAGAVACVGAGAAADGLAARVGLTRTRKVVQSVAFLGPAAALLAMGFLEETRALTRGGAEALFVFAIACQATSGAGFGCAAQDIARRDAALVYGATSVPAVAAGAASQYLTGVVLDATDRDFSYVFVATALVQIAGCAAWWAWWDSERSFE